MNLNLTAQVRPAFAPRLRRPKGWSKIAAALTILALVGQTLAKDFTTMASINYTHPVQKYCKPLGFRTFPRAALCHNDIAQSFMGGTIRSRRTVSKFLSTRPVELAI